MKKPTIFLIASLLVSALKNISVPEQYNIMIGVIGHQQTANNFIYFIGNDLCLFFLTLTVLYLSKQNDVLRIIANGALSLSIGKIVDEFTSPYGWHNCELAYDFCIVIWTIISLLRIKKNGLNEQC